MGVLGEVLVALLLITIPLIFSVVFLLLNSRVVGRLFAAFKNDMAARGFPLRGDAITSSSWNVRGEIAGTPIAMEPYSVTTGSGKHSQTRSYTALRIEAPTTLSRTGIYGTADVPLTELGAMREQTLPPALAAKYRAFSERPEDAAVWSSREVHELLFLAWSPSSAAPVGTPRSIETTSGALVLVLEGHPVSASLLVRAAELLVAIHNRRSIAPAPPPQPSVSLDSAWLIPASVPLFLSIFIGIPVACTPPILDAASPIACERGHIVNRHTNKSPLRCVDSEDRYVNEAHLIPILFGMSSVYYPLMLMFALWAGLRRPKQNMNPHDPARPGGGGAYR